MTLNKLNPVTLDKIMGDQVKDFVHDSELDIIKHHKENNDEAVHGPLLKQYRDSLNADQHPFEASYLLTKVGLG